MDKRVKKLLMTTRAAVIMIARGIELFIEEMEEEPSEVVSTANSDMAGIVAKAQD